MENKILYKKGDIVRYPFKGYDYRIEESLGLYRIHSRNDSTPKWNHIKELQSMCKELQKGKILKKRSDIILFKLLIERTRIKYLKYLILK